MKLNTLLPFLMILTLWTSVYGVLYADCRYTGKLQRINVYDCSCRIGTPTVRLRANDPVIDTLFAPAIALEEALR